MKCILVVEDEPNIRQGMCEILEFSGYEVRSAENGEQALTVLQNTAPEIILTDIMMPKLDGFGLLKAIQSNNTTASIPVIAITGNAAPSDIARVMSLGAKACLIKPVLIDELLTNISKILDSTA